MIIDSSVFIASIDKNDENNKRAEALLPKAEKDRASTTDHVLEEVVTYLNRKAGSEVAHSAGSAILDSFEIIFFTEENLREALGLVKKYKKLSLCDALSVVAAREMRDKTICSFDSDFDFVEGIRRIC